MWPKCLWKKKAVYQCKQATRISRKNHEVPYRFYQSSVQKLTFKSSAKPDNQGDMRDTELFEELKKNNTLLQIQIKQQEAKYNEKATLCEQHLEQKDTLMQNAASRRVSHDFWLIFHVVITHAQLVLTKNKLR